LKALNGMVNTGTVFGITHEIIDSDLFWVDSHTGFSYLIRRIKYRELSRCACARRFVCDGQFLGTRVGIFRDSQIDSDITVCISASFSGWMPLKCDVAFWREIATA